MTRTGFDLQDMISRLGGDHSWEALEGLQSMFAHPERKKLAEEEKAMKEAAQRSFGQDLVAIFSTGEGKRVLEELVSGTIARAPVNLGVAGLGSDQVGVMAAYREGQNSIIHAILTDLAKAGFSPSDTSRKGQDPCSTSIAASSMPSPTKPKTAREPEASSKRRTNKRTQATAKRAPKEAPVSTAPKGLKKATSAKRITKPSTN